MADFMEVQMIRSDMHWMQLWSAIWLALHAMKGPRGAREKKSVHERERGRDREKEKEGKKPSEHRGALI